MKELNNEILKKYEGLYEKFCNTKIKWFVKNSSCVLKLDVKDLELLKLLAKSIYSGLKGNTNYLFLYVSLELKEALELAKFLIELNFKNKVDATITDDTIEISLRNTIHYQVIEKHITNLLSCLDINEDNYSFENNYFSLKIGQEEAKRYKARKIDENNVVIIDKLSDLPITKDEVKNMSNRDIKAKGSIFAIEETLTKKKKYLYKIYATDYTESVLIVNFADTKMDYKIGDTIEVIGRYELSAFSGEAQIGNSKIAVLDEKIKNPYELIFDNEFEERAELHVHSSYSQMDGIVKPEEIFKNAKALGINALAICDHENVQNFPTVEALSKQYNIKPIYAVELNMLDDSKYQIFHKGNDKFDFNKIVAIDIETTGFSALYDEITQISCIKEENGKISEYNTYVKISDKVKLTEKITELTGITNELLEKEGKDVKTALNELINFIGNGVLVAHNARFDVDFIEEKIQRELGIKKSYSYVDTLTMSRHFLKDEMKKFSLNKVASKCNVDLSRHHNAKFDTEACYGIYKALVTKYTTVNYEINEVEDNNVYDVEIQIRAKKALEYFRDLCSDNNYTINSIEDVNEGTGKTNVNMFYKMSLSGYEIFEINNFLEEYKTSKIVKISRVENALTNPDDLNQLITVDEKLMDANVIHINVLVKNEVGKKELFKLISLAHLERITNHGTVVFKSDLTKELRDNCLIGSSCVNGLFKQVYEKGNHAINPNFFDFIEIQPKNAYLSISDRIDTKAITDCVNRIYEYSKKNNKILVIDTDAHYLSKESKEFRLIYTKTKFAGNFHPLANKKEIGDNFLYGTKALKNQISIDYPFMQNDVSTLVIDNPKKIADMIDNDIKIVSKKLYAPLDDFFKEKSMEHIGHQVDSCKEELENIVNEALEQYKFNGVLPEYVKARVDKELKSIIGNGYYSNYYISYLLVKKSLDDGYVVGSRGSVGSSFVANLMGITEVNALKPHYYCPKCHYQLYKGEKEIYKSPKNKQLFLNLEEVTDGYDLKNASCPCCNSKLLKDGHDIPFETFLGFNGDKVPDIDLNFSGVYQPKAMNFLRDVFGPEKSFRAGTIGTVAEKTAQLYVSDFNKLTGIQTSNAEIVRKGKYLEEVKRTTGQHAGGIIVLPSNKDIYDFSPIQYPANSPDKEITTHFEYHEVLDEALLKFDILGHDDPTMLKFLMDNVKANPSEYPFKTVKEIPFTDEKVIALLREDADGIIDSLGISEFGTNFVTNMLHEIAPKTFSDLVKVSGLSHGTDVWANNNQELVNGSTEFGKIDFANTIGCRDDIMVQLMEYGLEPSDAFDIMEFVRKGKLYKGGKDKWEKYKSVMKEHNVPDWYIWSCEQIKYMFPKAHAVAYVLSALRIAWFKAYKPLEFYQAMFSVRANQFDVESIMSNDVEVMRDKIDAINEKGSEKTANDEDNIHYIELAIEMVNKGFKFKAPVINKSHSTNFVKLNSKTLLMPFSALKGVGEAMANKIYENRTTPYKDLEDFKSRSGANKKVIDALTSINHLCF